MIFPKGYILIHCIGEYEDRKEIPLLFSTDKSELQEIESDFNSNQYELRRKSTESKELVEPYFKKFEFFIFANKITGYLDKNQFDEFITNNPIPEELEGLVIEDSDFIDDSQPASKFYYLIEKDYFDLHSYYFIKELQGVNSNE